jgi:hypothetical protein
MKKFLAVLGVVFLIVIVLGAIGFGYIAYRGNALDKESKAYVDAAIPAIFTNWNKNEFASRTSPEFRKVVTDDQLDRMFRSGTALGRMMTFDSAEGHADISVSPQAGKMITARYNAKAYFEKGNAFITLDIIKHDNHWQIMAFYVNGPKLAPK